MKERKVLAKVAHHRLRKNALLLTRLNACVHCSIFERVCASQDEIILKSRFFFIQIITLKMLGTLDEISVSTLL